MAVRKRGPVEKALRRKPKPRNRAAQDATLINVRALNKRVARLESHVRDLHKKLQRGVARMAVV